PIAFRVVKEPPHVSVINAAHRRTVRIAAAVSKTMMVHVVTGPPQRAFLHGSRSDERPDEPRRAPHLKRAMGKIAVECQRQADRAHEMRNRPQAQVDPPKSHREGKHDTRLNQPEDSDLNGIRKGQFTSPRTAPQNTRRIAALLSDQMNDGRSGVVSPLLRIPLPQAGRGEWKGAALRGNRTGASRARAGSACRQEISRRPPP